MSCNGEVAESVVFSSLFTLTSDHDQSENSSKACITFGTFLALTGKKQQWKPSQGRLGKVEPGLAESVEDTVPRVFMEPNDSFGV